MTRHKQPREIAVLSGAIKNHPERYPEVPKSDLPVGEPPERLTDDQRAAWFEICAQAVPGTMTHSDRQMVEHAARLTEQCWRQGDDFPASRYNTLIGILGRFGMSASDRSKLGVVNREDDDNPYARLKPIR